MDKIVLIASLLTSITLFGQKARTNSDWAMQQPYVVLVSIDGFRYDYAEKFGATNLLDLKTSGSSAETLIPSFPSKTFPNHYTLVTGLTPSHHGIIGNSFYSRTKKDSYRLTDKSKVLDSAWYGGMPIWSLAEKNEMLSASYFWAGSEAAIQGLRPTYWKEYDGYVPNEERTDQVLDWLNYEPAVRPHFITLYFSLVDDAGHGYGPDSEETKQAVLSIDSLIGKFRDELKSLDLPHYLIITSDHGMASTNKGLSLADIDFNGAIVDYSSTMVMVYHDDPKIVKRISKQLGKKKLLQIHTRDEMALKYNFENADRVGDLVALASPPIQILQSPRPIGGGTHGYDPIEFKDMHAIFIVEGPNVRKELVLQSFSNIHVYPFVADLLGLPIPDGIDGDCSVLQGILIKD